MRSAQASKAEKPWSSFSTLRWRSQTVAVVTREAGEAQRLLADAERYLASREWELGHLERELVTLDDE